MHGFVHLTREKIFDFPNSKARNLTDIFFKKFRVIKRRFFQRLDPFSWSITKKTINQFNYDTNNSVRESYFNDSAFSSSNVLWFLSFATSFRPFNKKKADLCNKRPFYRSKKSNFTLRILAWSWSASSGWCLPRRPLLRTLSLSKR